jgi:hypothetical protein
MLKLSTKHSMRPVMLAFLPYRDNMALINSDRYIFRG